MTSTPIVAIVGLTGLVGTAILPTLLSTTRITLRLLATDPSSPALTALLSAAPAGHSAVVVRIDWAASDSLLAALEGVDVLVSTIKSRGDVAGRWEAVIVAATAAKAGVKIYFPSEFGTDPAFSKRNFPPAGFEFKIAHKAAAEALGLKVLCLYTGMFLEGGMSARNGIDTDSNVWELEPPGDVPFAFTSTRDLGPLLLRAILTAVHAPALLPTNGGLRVLSSCESWSLYADTWQRVTGEKVEKKWLTSEELEEGMSSGPAGGFVAFVKVAGQDGSFDHSEGNVMEVLEREEVGRKWEKVTMEVLAKERASQGSN